MVHGADRINKLWLDRDIGESSVSCSIDANRFETTTIISTPQGVRLQHRPSATLACSTALCPVDSARETEAHPSRSPWPSTFFPLRAEISSVLRSLFGRGVVRTQCFCESRSTDRQCLGHVCSSQSSLDGAQAMHRTNPRSKVIDYSRTIKNGAARTELNSFPHTGQE